LLEACQAQVAQASVVACPLVVLVVLASVAGCLLVVSVAACLLAALVVLDSVVLGELQGDNPSVRGLKVPPLSVHVVLISKSGSIH
jgi:hypothetical protein